MSRYHKSIAILMIVLLSVYSIAPAVSAAQRSISCGGAVIAQGVDVFPLLIFGGVEQGSMIRLNNENGQLTRWKPGSYTVTLSLNPRHNITEAYYLNNTVEPCRFTIIPSILGDADLDGEVDITDATTIQRYDICMTELSDTAKHLADADRDGNVDILDTTWIQRFLIGMKAPDGIGEAIR